MFVFVQIRREQRKEMARSFSVAVDYDSLLETSNFIKQKLTVAPELGLICGTGLGELADSLSSVLTLSYADIPGFPVPSVEGHEGQFVYGKLGGKWILCMRGRCHTYEGYQPIECAMPVRVMFLLGVKKVILTAAAGALNSNYRVGDVMLINDHFCLASLAGISPLTGPNDSRFGPRFPDLRGAYSTNLRNLFRIAGKESGFSVRLHDGVYGMIGGPAFPTPMENKFIRMAGSDVVGMSIVWESTVAHHCGMEVLAVAVITSISEDSSCNTTLHDEVLAVGKQVCRHLVPIFEKFIESL
ncbi:Purine nucleoside phosphorylase 1 [Trichinella patagoniensis]|uniref:Purine nucleoside phosphorylase n=1 Tax=Trichinella patagoniensis TaxID=990121 RepID=A0A0V0ZHI6_9BILA|nr:Purine nucleoside phosphorylase 1 [Trichinella patagoniensis]